MVDANTLITPYTAVTCVKKKWLLQILIKLC